VAAAAVPAEVIDMEKAGEEEVALPEIEEVIDPSKFRLLKDRSFRIKP